jgi:chitin disaccharide deacetylase
MIKCADDFGLNDSVNEAIIQLAVLNKIDCTSILIEKASLEDCLKLKKIQNGNFKVGLHLDIFNMSKMWSWNLLLNPQKEISKEINKQIQLFYKKMGKYPDFYDGHMHCQVYPLISESLIEETKKLKLPFVYIRSLNMRKEIFSSSSSSRKKIYVYWLALLNSFFVKKLQKNNILTNTYVYGTFNNHTSFENIFEISKKYETENNSIFFSHPSTHDLPDSVLRVKEFNLLKT